MDVDNGANISKIEEPASIFSPKVDTAMAHGRPKVIMPVSAVQSIALVEIHHVRDIAQIVAWACHISVAVFNIDLVLPGNRRCSPGSSRNRKSLDQIIALIGVGSLG